MNATISQAEVAVQLGGKSMTDHAAAGVSLPAESSLTGAGIDRETVVAMALKASETKRGGAVFKAAVLVDKVRAQVRSRLGLGKSELVPVAVNTIICDVCAAIVVEFNAALAKRGFVAERASSERNRVRGKEGEETLDRVVTVTHAKGLTFAEQRNAARLELASIADKLDKHERGQTPNGKPDTRPDEKRAIALAGLLTRKERLEAVVANAERELARIAELAKANGLK